MPKCVFQLKISGNTESKEVTAEVSFSPACSFSTDDEVPAAYWAGIQLMHIFSLLPDADFTRDFKELIARYRGAERQEEDGNNG